VLNLSIVRQKLESKSDNDLLDIISYSQDGYEPEVIPLIIDVLLNRGIELSTVNEAQETYRKIKSETAPNQLSQKRVPKLNRFVLWVLYVAGIVMLMHFIKLIREAALKSMVEDSRNK
jgi:hypothetical protein